MMMTRACPIGDSQNKIYFVMRLEAIFVNMTNSDCMKVECGLNHLEMFCLDGSL